MDVGDDTMWTKLSFIVFCISLCALVVVMLTQGSETLTQNPLTGELITNASKYYTTSGVVESVRDNDGAVFIRVQTFCTVTAQYDTLFHPGSDVAIGDFVTITGEIEEYNGKQYLQVSRIE